MNSFLTENNEEVLLKLLSLNGESSFIIYDLLKQFVLHDDSVKIMEKQDFQIKFIAQIIQNFQSKDKKRINLMLKVLCNMSKNHLNFLKENE